MHVRGVVWIKLLSIIIVLCEFVLLLVIYILSGYCDVQHLVYQEKKAHSTQSVFVPSLSLKCDMSVYTDSICMCKLFWTTIDLMILFDTT